MPKIKIYVEDEDYLYQFFCDNIAKCSGEQPTESDPTGCTGCDAQEEWVEKLYDEHIISEVKETEFLSVDEVIGWIDGEEKYKNEQTSQFQLGYFHALGKLKKKILQAKKFE